MIGRDLILSRMEAALAQAKGEATVTCYSSSSGLTRYASNYVHQNMMIQSTSVTFRVKLNNRLGVASTTGLESENLAAALRKAEAIAKVSPEMPWLPPLPEPAEYDDVLTYVQETADYSEEDRARAVKEICDLAKDEDAVASGAFSTGYGELAVANTAGVRAYTPLSSANINCIISKDGPSGYSASLSRDVNEIDMEDVGRLALDKCLAGRNRVSIEPGDYEVVLEHVAVADLFEWLGYIGFGSKPMEEKTSFLANRIGNKIMGTNINIYDDGHDPRALAIPFDFEGVPKRKVYFLENGVAKGAVHDTISAARADEESTGHSIPLEEASEGSMSMNLVVAPGDSDVETMASNVKRGILITRFHYINGFIDTRNAVLTGMTRDGTFLIQDGKIKAGLPNLRFMQNMLEALSDVKEISADQKSCASWWGDAGAYVTPAMRIGSFRFIGIQQEE